MTPWYDPRQLIRTAVRVVTSTWFGRLFDRRDLMAALDPFDEDDFWRSHDHSADNDIWIDYVADMGDGWRPTHAVASLMAQPRIVLTDEARTLDLPRAKLAVFGGDQVYPWPTIEAYRHRLEAPWRDANRRFAPDYDALTERLRAPHWLYAIPGNHDWYDGLSAFTYRFCARRPERAGRSLPNEGHAIAGRGTAQTRSYFACKLPGKWWLCGVDVQLEGWVDDEQNAFFHYVSQRLMEHGSNVIVCTPTPQWTHIDRDPDALTDMAYICAIISGDVADANRDPQASYRFAKGDPRDKRRHFIRLTLAGDSHHYARWREGEGDAAAHYITCGLGGAYLEAPAAQPQTVSVVQDYPPPLPAPAIAAPPQHEAQAGFRRSFRREAAWPEPAVGRKLAATLPAFGWRNLGFSAAVAALSMLVAWQLVASATAAKVDLFADFSARFGGALRDFVTRVLFHAPEPLIVVGCLAAALSLFADARRPALRAVIGVAHAFVYVGGWLVAFGAAAILIAQTGAAWPEPVKAVALVLAMGVWAFIIPPFVFGLYLWASWRLLGVHAAQAFCALRVENYKGFLRMHIDPQDRLTIYPVGFVETPRDDSAPRDVRLIEPPIVIEAIDRPPPRPA